jgi:gliding motility-associated-like protein
MHRLSPRSALLLLGSLLLHVPTWAQLNVNTTFTPASLVNDILVGQGVTVTNLIFNGAPATTINDQAGAFYSTNSNIGLNDGIVLATGRVVGVTGSNQNTSLTLPPAIPVNVADPDLAMIETSQRCVAVLEFDFIPTGDSISFRFVFGSEEYPEYVCSQYNDVFGFFLSGPGINGPFTNNAINLGVLPNSTIPIAVNTVNSGSPGALSGGPSLCTASDPNWQMNSVYYVNNQGGATVELDGFTVPIRTGAAVQCGQTYHIKIAIAHAGDASLDSAVFIEGGSFSSNSVLNATATTPQQNGTLTEGCGDAIITLEVPVRSADATIQLAFRGTDIDENDLSGSVATVTIPSGTASTSFPMSAVADGIEEGAEQLWVVATWVADCGSTATDSVRITLLDYSAMEIFTNDQYLGCDRDSVELDALVSGGLGDVTISWPNGFAGASTNVSALDNATYTVRATDECPKTVTADVQVFSGCGLSIPNVITPNNDGYNDAWVIDGLHRTKHSVTVFNRWGQVVFESNNYANNWRAVGVADGTYFYEVISDREEQPAKGTLTILGNGQR